MVTEMLMDRAPCRWRACSSAVHRSKASHSPDGGIAAHLFRGSSLPSRRSSLCHRVPECVLIDVPCLRQRVSRSRCGRCRVRGTAAAVDAATGLQWQLPPSHTTARRRQRVGARKIAPPIAGEGGGAPIVASIRGGGVAKVGKPPRLLHFLRAYLSVAWAREEGRHPNCVHHIGDMPAVPRDDALAVMSLAERIECHFCFGVLSARLAHDQAIRAHARVGRV